MYKSAPYSAKWLNDMENSNRFEILGRFDHSEIRGCNLLSVN